LRIKKVQVEKGFSNFKRFPSSNIRNTVKLREEDSLLFDNLI
jgi:hypothetical protein